MADYEVLKSYREAKFDSILCVLNKSSELIAFIKVYGALYDSCYMSLILNLNNITEHFLETFNPCVIEKLYGVYSKAKKAEKSDKEIFEQLRSVLYELPVPTIMDASDRRNRKQF